MKKTALVFSLFVSLIVQAQILDYNDFGILLTNENIQGTARTMAMKNAFGALGGDLSAIHINPAGAAVFSQSMASFTLSSNAMETKSNFYGTESTDGKNHFSLAQAGGVLLFYDDEDEGESNIKKVSIVANLNTINNFNNSWIAKGLNSPTWINEDATIDYTNVDSYQYSNFTEGSQTSFNFAIAAEYGNSLYLGASFNAYDLTYKEDSKREERSSDDSGNSIDAFESFWQEVNGDGFSFSLGAIYKPIQSIRLGLSYTTPTWYELTEDSNMFAEDENDTVGYYNLIYSDIEGDLYNNIDKVQTYDYVLRTPSKTTGSFAFVFGKKGLISADYTKKNYKNIHLGTGGVFNVENKWNNDNLKNTYQLNLGTEWRIKEFSLRGGYSYEQTPYIEALETDNIKGYAFGLGYNFGNYKIDIAYDYKENTDYFNFYPDIAGVNGAELTKYDEKVMATLSLKF